MPIRGEFRQSGHWVWGVSGSRTRAHCSRRTLAATLTVTAGIRERLRQLSGGVEASVELWLRTPHPMLDGDGPQEITESGEGELGLKLVRHMLSGAPT